MNNDTKYSIKTASRLSGVSPYVIRAWERRYNILSPQRTETNRRVYSDAEVEKLRLLGEAVKNGSTISNIASLSIEELKRLNARQQGKSPESNESRPVSALKSGLFLQASLKAISSYDPSMLESTLEKGAVDMGLDELLNGLIIPLIHKIGEDWYNGELRIAQEHMASSVLAAFLKDLVLRYKVSPYAPVVLVCTPRGQMHELGSLLAGVVAASEGWNVVELGPDLPAEEIVAAAKYSLSKAVCLSIVYPDEEGVPNELQALGKLLKGKAVIVGGRAAHLYKEILYKEGFMLIEDFWTFRKLLSSLIK
ncbi:MAG TPA: MerR family transcriptional regulator [Ignavibacteriales bacterium]|nr:MerR family transcriptional regulator [Ignavibacteriales bacterium]